MPLQATSGAASYDGFGGGVTAVPNYIEDVFSTYLYTGNSTARSITNNIDLSTKGGMVWFKARNVGSNHYQVDTARGNTKYLASNSTTSQMTFTDALTAFTTTGFNLGVDAAAGDINGTGYNMASWTFRKQPKFFDVVTYTGTGSVQNISHNLGSAPACMIVKDTTNAGSAWAIYHTSLGNTQYLQFTTSAAGTSSGYWNNTSPTSTQFTVGTNGNVNQSGATYVAYLFASNAGGFGLTGTDNVISCGSFSGNTTVNLGWEPQWVLMKTYDVADSWYVLDNMRGWTNNGSNGNDAYLNPNSAAAETTGTSMGYPTSTGFTTYGFGGANAIYIAIRRGPMKVPTSGTSVFAPVAQAGNGTVTTNFPVSLSINTSRSGQPKWAVDRLRGSSSTASAYLYTQATNAEATTSGYGLAFDNNTGYVDGGVWGSGTSAIYWNFQRAPSFFDEVCYTGTGTNQFINHNLGVQPDLYIVKRRSATANWVVTINASIPDTVGILNSTNAFGGSAYNNGYLVNGTVPASNFGAGFGSVNNDAANASGSTYVAYLFATCAGVSKVGSYTGNGTTQTIDCGFTGGARFVLIKRTDSTGDWYVYDTARGMTVLTDPYLLLNSTAAESATLGSVTTVSTGFAVNASILAAINTNGASYIFLAIA